MASDTMIHRRHNAQPRDGEVHPYRLSPMSKLPIHHRQLSSSPTRLRIKRRHWIKQWVFRVIGGAFLLRSLSFIGYMHSNLSFRSSSSDFKRALDLPLYPAPHAKSQETRIILDRKSERQQRSRPTRQSLTESSLLRIDPWTRLPVQTLSASTTPTTSWSSLCQAAQFNADSRVVITNIISQPLAKATALLITKQCNVSNIVGVDLLFPNRRRTRVQAMKDVRMLTRMIDNFVLQISLVGLRTHEKRNYFSADWVRQFAPTHILQFQSELRDWQETMEESAQRLYHAQHTQMGIQDIFLSYLAAAVRDKPRIVNILSDTASHHPAAKVAQSFAPVLYGFMKGIPVSHLYVPMVTGPMMVTTRNASTSTPTVFVNEAVVAVLQASRPRQQQIRLHLKASSTLGEWNTAVNTYPTPSSNEKLKNQVEQTLSWQHEAIVPFGNPRIVEDRTVLSENTNLPEPFTITNHGYYDTFALYAKQFPCSSSCRSMLPCRPSVFDLVQPISRQLTEGCEFVVYVASFSEDLETLEQPFGDEAGLCRVAFVSGKSRLVQGVLSQNTNPIPSGVSDKAVVYWNGKLKYGRWNLVWLPYDDATTLTDAETALLRIDPAEMFADTVRKVMYSELPEFTQPADGVLLRILSQVNRQGFPQQRVREKRPGTAVSRFHLLDAQRPRLATLFAAEPAPGYLPKSAKAFVALAGPNYSFPKRQVSFYTRAAHLIQTNDMRPEDEIRSTVYLTFPYQWISMTILIHDLVAEQSRQLRCSWYDEYLFWGGNGDAEELSFAFIMANARIEGSVGLPLVDPTWIPWMDGEHRLHTDNQKELFLRIMKHKT